MSIEKTHAKPGRPRSESVRRKILQTTVGLMIERGYKAATMKRIASSARVGKQTLYRWWHNRAELLMEALLFYAEENVDTVLAGLDRRGLEAFLAAIFQSITKETGEILRGLIVESIVDEAFASLFFENFIKQRQKRLEYEIKLLQKTAEPDPQKMGIAIDIIFGAMWYRLIFRHRPLDNALANELAAMVTQLVS
jgi:AcrR family transcriptional regulator